MESIKMKFKAEPISCQIFCLPRMAQPIGIIDNFQYIYRRTKRFLKRRLIYMRNRFASTLFRKNNVNSVEINGNFAAMNIQAGDFVHIKSKDVIRATLNNWNNLKGCAFLEEMSPYCSTNQRVYKRVERFLDERDYHMKKCHGLVILEGVFCHGTVDFGKCDRTCYFFWREEWLEKLE
jgi:hypothetical protein